MKTLALTHGDLVVGSTGYATLDGAAKVLQDVRCALLEPLGTDRFHPGFGSSLDQFVGQQQDSLTATTIQTEIRRVVDQYAAVQRDRLERDALSGTASRYATDDVLAAVTSINVKPVQDRIYVQVNLTTAAGTPVTLVTSVGT